MRFILAVISVILLFPGFSSAQGNNNESLTFSTYFPAPIAIYKNPKLVPRDEPPANDSGASQPGTLYFNNTAPRKLYLRNNVSWSPLGGAVGSGLVIDSGHNISPSTCYGGATVAGQTCNWDGFYQTIPFTKTFTSAPNVTVTQEWNPSPAYCPCCRNATDQILIYVTKVTSKNFTVQAAGTPQYASASCDDNRARIDIGWIAIGN